MFIHQAPCRSRVQQPRHLMAAGTDAKLEKFGNIGRAHGVEGVMLSELGRRDPRDVRRQRLCPLGVFFSAARAEIFTGGSAGR